MDGQTFHLSPTKAAKQTRKSCKLVNSINLNVKFYSSNFEWWAKPNYRHIILLHKWYLTMQMVSGGGLFYWFCCCHRNPRQLNLFCFWSSFILKVILKTTNTLTKCMQLITDILLLFMSNIRKCCSSIVCPPERTDEFHTSQKSCSVLS